MDLWTRSGKPMVLPNSTLVNDGAFENLNRNRPEVTVDQSGRQRRKREKKPNDDKRQRENPSRIKNLKFSLIHI
jgi:hypothetical protein